MHMRVYKVNIVIEILPNIIVDLKLKTSIKSNCTEY